MRTTATRASRRHRAVRPASRPAPRTRGGGASRAVARLRFTLQSTVDAEGIPSRAALRRYARVALERDARVNVRIVDGREGRALNRRYRGRDYATNVLTFVYDDGVSLAGDIVLCAPVVAREARAQRKTLRAHYAHLVIHGMLHLQGYDHERNDDAARMEAREVGLLRSLGVADPYS